MLCGKLFIKVLKLLQAIDVQTEPNLFLDAHENVRISFAWAQLEYQKVENELQTRHIYLSLVFS